MKLYPTILTIFTSLIYTQDTLTFLESPLCYLHIYSRGRGSTPTKCRESEQMLYKGQQNFLNLDHVYMCFPKCRPGFSDFIDYCYQICPEGFETEGSFCRKPASYGRGGGYIFKEECEQETSYSCERNLLLFYPKCKEGYHNVGCCICSKDCPAEMTDIGVSCYKHIYRRNGEQISKECRSNEDTYHKRCYRKCKDGYFGIGPVCLPYSCPVGSERCGNACLTFGTCTEIIKKHYESKLNTAVLENYLKEEIGYFSFEKYFENKFTPHC
jgi:hypothetical protein